MSEEILKNVRYSPETDLERMPVEDASVYSPERRVFADDVLTFNTWHCLVEHQPIGSIQRARRSV